MPLDVLYGVDFMRGSRVLSEEDVLLNISSDVVEDWGMSREECYIHYIRSRYGPTIVVRSWGWKSFEGRRRVRREWRIEMEELVGKWYDSNGFVWMSEKGVEGELYYFEPLLMACDRRRPDYVDHCSRVFDSLWRRGEVYRDEGLGILGLDEGSMVSGGELEEDIDVDIRRDLYGGGDYIEGGGVLGFLSVGLWVYLIVLGVYVMMR